MIEKNVPGNAPSAYRSDIDGLRAVAVVAVVLFHVGIQHLTGGFVGVDVFFVISGLLIGAHVYADVKRDRFSVGAFYRKRAKRILPALMVLLCFCYTMAVLLLTPGELKRFGGYALATVLSGSNIFAWSTANYFAPKADQNPLLMTWSLGVEEQFYIIFPLLMLLIGKMRRRRLFGWAVGFLLISLLVCVVATSKRPTAAFYLLPSRAWEILAGFLLALYENGRNARTLYRGQRYADVCSIAGLAAIAFSMTAYNSHTPFPGYSAVLPVLGTILLLASPGSWINRTVLSSRPFTAIGAVSYSLYLWHWPLLSFAHVVSDRPLSTVMACGIALLSLVLAMMSYWWIEQPFRKSNTQNPKLLLRYGLLSAAVAVPALVFVLTSGLPRRTPQAAFTEQMLTEHPHTCLGTSTPDLSRDCVDRDDPRPAVALLGDSHAEALAPALGELAHRAGYKLYKVAKPSCTPLQGAAPYAPAAPFEKECIDFYDSSVKMLTSDTRVKVIVITGYWAAVAVDKVSFVSATDLHRMAPAAESNQIMLGGMERLIGALKGAGKQVIVMLDVPIFQFDPARSMLSDATPFRRFLAQRLFHSTATKDTAGVTETYQAEDKETQAIVRAAAAAEGVAVFDPAQNICQGGTCTFAVGRSPLYFDNQHVTAKGGEVALAGFVLPKAE